MQLIDTHAHLYLDEFSNDLDQVIKRAVNSGIKKIVLPNIDSGSIKPLHKLSETYPELMVPLMGLHPTHVKENYASELDSVLKQLQKGKYKGIGEIGIDLYRDKSFSIQQCEVFEKQLDAALLLELPVVIHARDSFREILHILKQKRFAKLTGIFHAFTGTSDLAKEITSMGFLLGIGGILTYKNSGLPEAIKGIDIEHLVLETDSPYLSPVPFRGRRNESSYLFHVAQQLASIKGLETEVVCEITTRNAKKVFKI